MAILKRTNREIIADSVQRLHVGDKRADRAASGEAANLFGVLPDKLGEVPPLGEGGLSLGARVGTAIFAGREKLKLVIVPAVRDGASSSSSWVDFVNVSRCGPHGKILAVATTVDAPAKQLEP